MDIEFRDFLEPDEPTPEDRYRDLASSEVPFEAALGRMMLELLNALRREIIGPRLTGAHGIGWSERRALRLIYDNHGHSMTVTVMVDYKDCSPLVNGLPLLHYRLRADQSWTDRTAAMPDELRTRDVRTACEFILEAIRKCRGAM